VHDVDFVAVVKSNFALAVYSHYRNCSVFNIRKSFPNHKAHSAALIYVSASARHQLTLPDYGYKASASRSVSVNVPAFAVLVAPIPTEGWPGWVDLGGWLHTKMVYPSSTVTHLSTNGAQRWLTSLMRPTTLPTNPNRHHDRQQTDLQSPYSDATRPRVVWLAVT